MRIQISHTTLYRYDAPPFAIIQTLRLTPRNHDGQRVVQWRVALSEDCRIQQHEDAFGNLAQTFTAEGPFTEFRVSVNGVVDTENTQGIVRGTNERFPPRFFLRETALTKADAAIAAFADDVRAKATDELTQLHDLLQALNRDIHFDTDPTQTTTTAAEAFALKRGVCQDLTHIFIAAARHLGIPARYVGGHFHRFDGMTEQEAGHAWAEAFIPSLGWVAFDPTNGICATDAYVRVAIGLDYLGAAPVRGTRFGGNGETLTVAVEVEQAQRQSQS